MPTRDDDDIARDGEVLRVPMTMMDSAGGPSNAEARRAYEEGVQRLSDAWRKPAPAPVPAPDPNAREAALIARDEYLANAWRS